MTTSDMEVTLTYKQISQEIITDAAFVAGIMSAQLRLELVPIPVKVDGLETIAFCIRANPPGDSARTILHPIFIIPHEGMIIQDRRNGASQPLDRVIITPLDVRHEKFYVAALSNPEAFFGANWGK